MIPFANDYVPPQLVAWGESFTSFEGPLELALQLFPEMITPCETRYADGYADPVLFAAAFEVNDQLDMLGADP